MKKVIYMMAFLAMATQLTNCKKDDKDDDDDDTPSSVLCDGKGGSSWMRLDSANSWTYTWSIDGQNMPLSPKLVLGETTEHDSKTYRLLTDESGGDMLNYDYEYREDATTHDLYQYSPFGQEYLEVPGSPTLDQSWTTYAGWSRKVTSVSASVSSHDCNYTGLLEITEYDSNMDIKNKYYYKKGLGLVKQTRPSQIGEEAFVLSSVSLK